MALQWFCGPFLPSRHWVTWNRKNEWLSMDAIRVMKYWRFTVLIAMKKFLVEECVQSDSIQVFFQDHSRHLFSFFISRNFSVNHGMPHDTESTHGGNADRLSTHIQEDIRALAKRPTRFLGETPGCFWKSTGSISHLGWADWRGPISAWKRMTLLSQNAIRE